MSAVEMDAIPFAEPPDDGSPVDNDGAGYTEVGLAERIEREHSDGMRFCHDLGAWLHWDNLRWRADDADRALGKAKKTAAGIRAEAKRALAGVADLPPESRAAATRTAHKILKFADLAERKATMRNALDLAKPSDAMKVSPATLDADPMLLATGTAVVDLQTGGTREARRDDFITKGTAVRFNVDATSPTWDAFLSRILPDPSTREYLQRAVGYSLTGSVRDRVWFFLTGVGRNGKSTLIRVIQQLLGDYAITCPESLLLAKQNDTHPAELAELRGHRVALSNELPEGRAWNEARLKMITGNDTISARRMHCDFFEFEPTHKLWIAANHRPKVRAGGEAFWDRMCEIPFTVRIPEAEVDPKLGDKLTAELPGILNWAIAGCVAWQRLGMTGAPIEITSAGDAYRSTEDGFDTWLATATTAFPEAKMPRTGARKSYEDFCAKIGVTPVDLKTFTERMKGKFREGRTASDRHWVGVGLLDQGEMRQ